MADDSKPQPLQQAHDLADRVSPSNEGPKYADRPNQRGDTEALETEQRREADDSWAGPAVGAATDAQFKGLLIGSIVGGAIGLVLFLPLALIDLGLPPAGRVLLVAIVGALVGGTAGALYMGGRMPELEGETVDADGQPSRGSTARDESG
ncbi:MAG TPA: YrzE family protein [Acidimicrobiales bacterium]|nr:YrzE family protein [Acidimicrobiales bacterium]